ncbi:MAG: GIY-YIG nuclease family protein [bacterium]
MWWVYIIETESGSYYTGVAKDVNLRFRQHKGELKGGAKFFRSNPPSLLLYLKKYKSRSEAQKVEWNIKQLTRLQKEELIFS